LRWPEVLRGSEQAILDIPIDVTGNQVTQNNAGSLPQTPFTGPTAGVSSTGSSMTLPSLLGSAYLGSINYAASVPRLRLRHLVTPVDADGQPDPAGSYLRTGASTIYREQGKRLIAVKFSV